MPKFLSQTAYWQSPLHEQLLAWKPDPNTKTTQITVSELSRLGYVIVRGQASDAVFLNSAETALGVSLPIQATQTAHNTRVLVLWLSPDEWLVITAYAAKDMLIEYLTTALSGQFAQVVDNSGSLTSLYLSGEPHFQVLRHLTPFDVESLAMDQCASSVMSKSGVLLVRTDNAGMVLTCRRSFADYVWRLIQKAARPYGLTLNTQPKSHAVGIWRDLL